MKRRFPIFLGLALTTSFGCSSPPPAAAPEPQSPAPPDTVYRSPAPTVPVPLAWELARQKGTRDKSGAPGPGYWQPRVRYDIDAELDPEGSIVRGAQRVVFVNASPDTLPSVVLNLYQNVFAEGVPRNRAVVTTGGFTLQRVSVDGRELAKRGTGELPVRSEPAARDPAGYAVEGTLGRVKLPQPLLPGDSVTLGIDWQFQVPPASTFRTAWEEALGGRVFAVAQWYPQIAMYDDLGGWDTTPYLGDGEFYLPYGDFEVALAVPPGYLVGATGTLRNAEEILTPEARRRLAAALNADTVSHVVTEADLSAENATQLTEEGVLVWRFSASDVRDFAWAASDRYVWDVAPAGVGDEPGDASRVAVHVLYRPGAPNWPQAGVYAKHATELLSELLVPYPYPQLSVAEGPIGGMEYPMLIFIGRPAAERALYGVIAHEIAHQWFPMMVGQDEAAFAWMDEGTASYLDALAASEFFRDPEAFDPDRERYLAVAGTADEVPMMRHTDLVNPYGARTVAAYRKPAVLLRSLRAVVGDDPFAEALRTFADEWRYKHPTPTDFFNTVERVTNQDLDWFFYPWWYGTGVLDQAIESVEPVALDSVRVRVVNRGEIAVPTVLRATTADGRIVEEIVPVDHWLSGAEHASVVLSGPAPLVKVIIDPDVVFPDVDRSNNEWSAPEQLPRSRGERSPVLVNGRP